ncbi:hypothetical protein [Pseudonocardia sp. ICBG601]|uniref:MinD/ParA family ATP-binding protein n=1 Tax=Pseudonocardia sp. ICBG601 TaxID=2846759 RepID=UPI001CF70C21|nr:hypothetical protein [Pseudonocardia sp. ICBG601]
MRGRRLHPDEYEEAIAALSCCYNLMVVDTGTGLSHAALTGVLAGVDGAVIVAEPTADAASRASMTLDWLTQIGLGSLAAEAVVVMSHDRGSREIDERAVRDYFAGRCSAVVEVPADPHLAAGGRIDRERCRPTTRAAFEQLAAVVADGFATPRHRSGQRAVPGGF